MGEPGPRRVQPDDPDKIGRYLCLACALEPHADDLFGFANPPSLGHRDAGGRYCGPVIDLWETDDGRDAEG